MKPFAFVVSADPSRSTQLSALLRSSVPGCIVQTFTPASMAHALLPETPPHLVCLDVGPVGATNSWASDPLDVVRVTFPSASVLVTGDAPDGTIVAHFRERGALAFLPCAYSARQQEVVIALAWEGLGYFPRDDHANDRATGADKIAIGERGDRPITEETFGLTEKQLEVLSCVASGMTNREVAACLLIKEGTVKSHMTAILDKLQVDSRARAILRAQRMEAVRRHLMAKGERGTSVLDWLVDRVAHRRCAPGEILFRRGDPGGDLYYLQRGTIVLDDIGEEMGPGTMFGEVGVFAPNNVRTSTARCATPVDLFCLDGDHVKRICYEQPGFALHLMHLLAERLAAARGL